MVGRGYRTLPAWVRDRFRTDNCSRRRIDPIGLINASGQLENQAFLVSSRHDSVDVWFELAVVMVEGILFPALAHTPVVSAGGQTARHKAAVRSHLQKIEAFNKVFQAPHSLENRFVLGCPSGRVPNRVHTVQIVETRASADHELPGFHADVASLVSLV